MRRGDVQLYTTQCDEEGRCTRSIRQPIIGCTGTLDLSQLRFISARRRPEYHNCLHFLPSG